MNPAADGNPPQQPIASGPFRRALVAWDGSADSIAALRAASAIVGGSGGHVVALAVLPAAPHREAGKDRPAEVSAQARRVETAFESTRTAVAQTTSARIDLHTIENRHIAASVCDYAIEHGFDLLVIGRHGDGGLLHAKLGHVAEAATRTSKIPVLLVSASQELLSHVR